MKSLEFVDLAIVRTPLFPLNSGYDEALFSEAIYLASPNLHKEYIKQKTNNTLSEKERTKLNITLYKYTARASSRPTPFGLFAGLNVSQYGDKNEVVLHSDIKKGLRRKTRLD